MEKRILLEWAPLKEDTKWTCIRCGECCRRAWSVDLTWHEYRRILTDTRFKDHPVFQREVDPDSGLDHPFFFIKDKCPYLEVNGMICTRYPEWFYTCATYPFLLDPEGQIFYHTECRGIGQGIKVERDELVRKILKERERAGMMVKP
jgi:Fe-S-cluster containining protein